MIVVWSLRAIGHLADLRPYIGRENPAAAARTATILLAAVDRLAELIKSNEALAATMGGLPGPWAGMIAGGSATFGDNTASVGGLVGMNRILHLSRGGPVGTDTVNAWLTPGESVLTRK